MSANFRFLDERMMRRALLLATLGSGTALPNPRVGAVAARGTRILGQGYHRSPGELHAEALALVEAGERARGATLYTSLEPCCHTGRTPPCTDAILRSGIVRVVAAMQDPNPKVDGGGFRALRRGGIRVEAGLLKAEALRLNPAFVKHARTGRPLVTLKGAMTLDGRIATSSGESKWITSPGARRHARLLRSEHEAVLVGIGTVLEDDPRLDRRPASSGALLRVVLDRSLRLPPACRLARSAARSPLLLFCGRRAPAVRRARLLELGAAVEAVGERKGRLDLEDVLDRLGARGITSVLVEGGGEVHGSFLDRRLADRLALYVAPRILGGRDARPVFSGRGAERVAHALPLGEARFTRVGSDWLIEGSLARLE
jgi:diaminohydroxyphosphoribosylaminopyrimidine deaminase/5-amino-6-(5-phosphoribosylamino)uracil reductase